MKQIPTPLNNEERFFYAIAERLDAILDVLKKDTKPEPVKMQITTQEPVKAQAKPKKARKKQEG